MLDNLGNENEMGSPQGQMANNNNADNEEGMSALFLVTQRKCFSFSKTNRCDNCSWSTLKIGIIGVADG